MLIDQRWSCLMEAKEWMQSNQALIGAFLLGSISEIGGDYSYEAVKPYILQ